MEEKKFDVNSIIGFILIFAILIWMLYQNKSEFEQDQATIAKTETEVKSEPVADQLADNNAEITAAPKQNEPVEESQQNALTSIENDVLFITVQSKGADLVEVRLKSQEDFQGRPLYLVKDGNAAFGLDFTTNAGMNYSSRRQFFSTSLTEKDGSQIITLTDSLGVGQFIQFRYELPETGYLMKFSVQTKGINNIVDGSKSTDLVWEQKGRRQAKSISYENRYTRLTYQYEGEKTSKLSQTGEDDDESSEVDWLSFRQHFFSSILIPERPLNKVKFYSTDLVQDEDIDSLYTKQYKAIMPMSLSQTDMVQSFDWYFGPTDNTILKSYDKNLERSIPFGWGIFGWINRALFIPLFGYLSGTLPYGLAIIVMTILVRLVLSPVLYKSYLSQAKMKILRPELNDINAQFKDNAMKRQQETMALYRKAGVNPMSGCLPALIQLPVFYALFMFFPTAFDLRQKSFLWADDLSSYDSIYELPFRIPFYGDHVSLFPILASIAIFFYMKMTTGQQTMAQPTQEGMPDMAKMMKVMIYLSPIFMMVFFNNYASGLSLYYFVSNLITIGIMLVIKNVILDEDKIHAQIQENKKKPKAQNRFQRKMAEVMEQAEKQRNARK
jgi:YidC/Oxa1 family membrane protein insertase